MHIFRISALVWLVSLMSVCGCGGSAGGTMSTGRTVFTKSDSISLSSTFSSDTATVKTAGKTIVVAPTCLMVDGATVADIEATVSHVEISVKKGSITFIADGKPVKTTLR